MSRDHVQADRRLVVAVELGPVQSDDDLLAVAHHEAHPGLEQDPQLHPGVAQEPVDLLGRVLGVLAPDRRHPAADRVDRQAYGVHHPDDSQGDRVDAPLVDRLGEQLVGKALDALGRHANLSAATIGLRIGGGRGLRHHERWTGDPIMDSRRRRHAARKGSGTRGSFRPPTCS